MKKLTLKSVFLTFLILLSNTASALVGEPVCVLRWGFNHDRGYCGVVQELEGRTAKIKVVTSKAPSWGGIGNKCSEGYKISSLYRGKELWIPISCITD